MPIKQVALEQNGETSRLVREPLTAGVPVKYREGPAMVNVGPVLLRRSRDLEIVYPETSTPSGKFELLIVMKHLTRIFNLMFDIPTFQRS